LNTLDAAGVGFLQRVSARETLLGLKTVRQVGGLPFVPLRLHTVPAHKVRLKRLFDLTVVILLAPIAAPVLAVVALWVLVRSGRPLLYRQDRVGRDGVVFRCNKFRTMVPGAESLLPGLVDVAALEEPVFKITSDPRVTPVDWLRMIRGERYKLVREEQTGREAFFDLAVDPRESLDLLQLGGLTPEADAALSLFRLALDRL